MFHLSEANFFNVQFKEICINERPVNFIVDTGATMSLLVTSIFQSLNISLHTEVKADLETYDGHKLQCVGTNKVQIVLNGGDKLAIFRVVQLSLIHI